MSFSNKILFHLEAVTSLVTLAINLPIQICSTFDIQEKYLKGATAIDAARHTTLPRLIYTSCLSQNRFIWIPGSHRINIRQTSTISIPTLGNNSIFHLSGRDLLRINIQTSIVSWIKNVLDLVEWLARSPRLSGRGFRIGDGNMKMLYVFT